MSHHRRSVGPRTPLAKSLMELRSTMDSLSNQEKHLLLAQEKQRMRTGSNSSIRSNGERKVLNRAERRASQMRRNKDPGSAAEEPSTERKESTTLRSVAEVGNALLLSGLNSLSTCSCLFFGSDHHLEEMSEERSTRQLRFSLEPPRESSTLSLDLLPPVQPLPSIGYLQNEDITAAMLESAIGDSPRRYSLKRRLSGRRQRSSSPARVRRKLSDARPSFTIVIDPPSPPSRKNTRSRKSDPSTRARRKRAFVLEDVPKMLQEETAGGAKTAGGALSSAAIKQQTEERMRKKYRLNRRHLGRAFTCVSSRIDIVNSNEFKSLPTLAEEVSQEVDSEESDYESYEREHKMSSPNKLQVRQTMSSPAAVAQSRKSKVKSKKKRQRRHTRAMSVIFDQKEEDPDMKSAFQILALQPQQTASEIKTTMDNAPELIQYELEVNVDESEIASMMDSGSDEEDASDSNDAEVVLPAIPTEAEDIQEQNEFIQQQAALLKKRRKRDKMMTTRRLMIQELVSSEKVFLTQVVSLFTKIAEPLRAKYGLMTQEEHQTLFPSSLMDIQVFSSNLLRDLERYMKRNDDNAEDCLSEVLMGYAEKLHSSFADYACHYGEATPLAKQLQKKKQILEIFKADGGLSFFSLAIVPVQRPSRYLLLIKGILENTPEDHGDYEGLTNVKRAFGKANDEINETLRSFGEKKKVTEIARKTKRRRIQDRASRLLLRKGELTIVNDAFLSRKQDRLEAYLFNDLLMAGKFQSSNNLISSLFSRNNDKNFITLVEIKVDESFVVENLPDSYDPEIKDLILIKSRDQSVLLCADSPREKKLWLNSLSNCGDFGNYDESENAYRGPWDAPHMPAWWRPSCVTCGESHSKKAKPKRCIQCGSLLCETCHRENETCTPCRGLFNKNLARLPANDQKYEIGVSAHIWGFGRKNSQYGSAIDLLSAIEQVAATPKPPSILSKSTTLRVRQSLLSKKRNSVPYKAAPLPGIKDIEITLSVNFFDRDATATDVLTWFFDKKIPQLDLIPDDFGLELQDFPRQFIDGTTPLSSFHVLKNFKERLMLRVRTKTELVFMNRALTFLDHDDDDDDAFFTQQRTKHALSIPTFSEACLESPDFDPGDQTGVSITME